MIHRTLLAHGALRGGLVEHYAGAFPAWLALTQAMIIPITDKQADYADEVTAKLKDADVRVEVDRSRDRTGENPERAAPEDPYMLAVGGREAEAGAVAVRLRRAKIPARCRSRTSA